MSGSTSTGHAKIEKTLSESVHISVQQIHGFKRSRITSSRGYRSVMFNQHEIPQFHYFETILVSGDARIGIATRQAEINGPVGIDSFGYSLGTRNGYLFHEGKRMLFGDRIEKDSIISCLFFTESKKLLFFVNGERIGREITATGGEMYWPACSPFKKGIIDVIFENNFTFQLKIFKEFNLDL